MSETRIVKNGPDSQSMQKLCKPAVLGMNMWHNTIIVLTFANMVERSGKYQPDTSPEGIHKFYQEEFMLTKTAVHERLIHDVGLSKELVDSIPIVPAGYQNRSPTLPDLQTATDGSRSYWLSDLWLKALSVTKMNAQPALIKLNQHRMAFSEEEYAGRLAASKEAITKQVPLIFAKKGTDIGSRSHNVRTGSTGPEEGRESGLALGHKLSFWILAEQAEKNKILTEEEYQVFKLMCPASTAGQTSDCCCM